MLSLVCKIKNSVENCTTSFWLGTASLTSLIILRLLLENWLSGFKNMTGTSFFYEFSHTFLFFTIAFLLFTFLFRFFFKISFKKISNVLLWGFFIILIPPLFDYFHFGGENYWRSYEFEDLSGLVQSFFTFFGNSPRFGITQGIRLEIVLALMLIFLYSFVSFRSKQDGESESSTFRQIKDSTDETKSNFSYRIFKTLNLDLSLFVILEKYYLFKILAKSLVVTMTAYAVFFILGTLPSGIAIVYEGFTRIFANVSGLDATEMFLSPAKIFSREVPDIISAFNLKMSIICSLILIALSIIGCWLFDRQKTLSFVKNARYPQIIIHWGLIVIGMGLASIFTQTVIKVNFFNTVGFILLEAAVCFAWLVSVIPNDIADRESDKITPNKNRPLVTKTFSTDEFKTVGWVLFVASLMFSAIINFKIVLFLVIYQAIAWIYSAWPLRLKRFAFVSSFLSSLALLMILFSGFVLIAPDQSLKTLPFSIITLLAVSYTLSLPIKDFKDVEGDKKEGVYTVPVLFGEQWGKIITGSGVLLSFLLSVILLNEFRLFWWALIFGLASFLIVLASGKEKRVAYKRLPWWIMSMVLIYGLILVRMVFL